MPPKRRTGTRSAAAAQQRQLSFHGKTNKIVKPGTEPQDEKASKKSAAIESAIEQQNTEDDIETRSRQPTKTEKATKQQVEEEVETSDLTEDPLARPSRGNKTSDVLGGRAKQDVTGATGGKGSGWVNDEEAQARKISEAKIKEYWRHKEEARIAPRIHQNDLSLYEKILREWDMSGEYGPCIGIARLKRWKRANMLGLKPPIEVLAVLLKDMDKGQVKAQRAYVDELMGTRFIEA